ncbi:MAG: heavy-metal-associated domain-containing protein [Bacillota bacterium]
MAEKTYKLGGMNDPGSADEIDFTLSHVDGVKKVTVDRARQEVTVSFDPEKVTETHLKGTLASLGHGIL